MSRETESAAAQLVYDAQDIVGESIIWSADERALYWVDIGGKRIHRLEVAGGRHDAWQTPDFVTSIGHVSGGDSRSKLGVKTKGPTRLITDLALLEPDPATKEMTIVSIHPGVTRDQIQENTGWKVAYAAKVAETPPPTQRELDVLRDLQARTKRAQEAA